MEFGQHQQMYGMSRARVCIHMYAVPGHSALVQAVDSDPYKTHLLDEAA
jgi:hypothetical protein